MVNDLRAAPQMKMPLQTIDLPHERAPFPCQYPFQFLHHLLNCRYVPHYRPQKISVRWLFNWLPPSLLMRSNLRLRKWPRRSAIFAFGFLMSSGPLGFPSIRLSEVSFRCSSAAFINGFPQTFLNRKSTKGPKEGNTILLLFIYLKMFKR